MRTGGKLLAACILLLDPLATGASWRVRRLRHAHRPYRCRTCHSGPISSTQAERQQRKAHRLRMIQALFQPSRVHPLGRGLDGTAAATYDGWPGPRRGRRRRAGAFVCRSSWSAPTGRDPAPAHPPWRQATLAPTRVSRERDSYCFSRPRLSSNRRATRQACREGSQGGEKPPTPFAQDVVANGQFLGGNPAALPGGPAVPQEAAYERPEIPKWRHKAVIIPGFATDSRAFEQLCHRLERRGIASVVVPIRWYHWLPTLGGRSVRPILDRIHETVIRCVSAESHKDMPYAFNEPGLQSKVAPYTVQDFLAEMDDPKRGAHHMGPLDLPVVPTEPSGDEQVLLIAHSAGGWISRIYLSEACYDGRMYNGSSLVSGLVTLGTPHVRLEDDEGRPRVLPFSRNFKFVEDFCTGEVGGKWESRTPTACIGGAVLRGRSTFGGLLKDLVYQSYELCCGDGTGIGDGITPLESAFEMAGARRFVELEGVYHAAGLGGPWYGSDDVIDSWLGPSLDTIFGLSTNAEDAPSSANTPSKLAVTPFTTGVSLDGDRVQKDAALKRGQEDPLEETVAPPKLDV